MAEAAKKIKNDFAFNINLDKNSFIKSLSKIQSVVEKRNTIPILSNVKIDASNNIVTLTVTDMDVLATQEIEASVNQGGSLTVPAQTLYDIIRKLPEGAQINLDADVNSSRLIVKSGSSKFKLSYLPSEDFPQISEGDLTHKFTLEVKTLLKLIEKTKFAMSNEETRYYLNGVYFHISNGKLRAVATDGHRLASVEVEAPEGSLGMPGVIIPRKAVNELPKLLEGQEKVTISISDSKIKFSANKIELLSKVVDGTFPDYQRVIPENNKKILTTSTSTLKEAVDRVSTIAVDKTKAVKISLSNNQINLHSQGVEGGSGDEDIAANYSSEALEMGFNSRYMLEMLNQIESAEVQFAFDNTNSPSLITDPTDNSAVYIIMPMRV
ncbi:MAG: DNA polymerase III subunit beta [Rickettsiales bacterium]|nr:DNA polymerase III subunit beta [Rickettsiales bacterium]